MEKLTQITFEVTDEQLERLDYIGIFDQIGVLFKSCRIMTGNAEPPIAEKVKNALKETRGANE